MGWRCVTCGESSDSDNLNFPVMHETVHPGHHVKPDLATASLWAGLL